MIFLLYQNLDFGVVSLILFMVLLSSDWRELPNGGYIVDFDLKVAFLDMLIGILHGDREEAADKFSFHRPF